MDAKGYEKITAALEKAQIDAYVSPEPEEGQDVRYLTIDMFADVSRPAEVLNALWAARLLVRPGSQDAVATRGPELSPIGISDTSITLEDKKGGYTRR